MATDPVLVRWPEEAARRADAADQGRPCLLLLAPGTSRPPVGLLEDWISATADERDVAARLAALRHRAERRPVPEAPPRTVPVAPAPSRTDDAGPARIARILVNRAGALVARRELADADTPDVDLDRLVERARPLLRSSGWTVHRVGSSGYLATRAAA